jgi:hypothetical protein
MDPSSQDVISQGRPTPLRSLPLHCYPHTHTANIVEFVNPSVGYHIEAALHWTSVSILCLFLVELSLLMCVLHTYMCA